MRRLTERPDNEGFFKDDRIALSSRRLNMVGGESEQPVFDEDGLIETTRSVSAGLDYPGVGPEHAFLKESGRAKYVAVNDKQALACGADTAIMGSALIQKIEANLHDKEKALAEALDFCESLKKAAK